MDNGNDVVVGVYVHSYPVSRLHVVAEFLRIIATPTVMDPHGSFMNYIHGIETYSVYFGVSYVDTDSRGV